MSGIGTWAYFSDVETVSNNVLAAGILDLKTDDVDGVSQTLLATNLGPGHIVGPETIVLKNGGTLVASSVDISFSFAESDTAPNPVDMSADDTAAVIEVITLKYNDSNILGTVSDSNSNGYKDIYDLSTANLTGLAGIAASATKNFEIAVQLKSDVSGTFQSDGIDITMTFQLNQ
jgi:predicted ribosomally synthesized peptide with SipW-like signal peptide